MTTITVKKTNPATKQVVVVEKWRATYKVAHGRSRGRGKRTWHFERVA